MLIQFPKNKSKDNQKLEIIHIAKRYGQRIVVKDVSFEVNKGEIVGLLGPNGAGKTTVFYTIMGLVKETTGHIKLNDKVISHLPMFRRARLGIGYLPQEASIFRGLSVEDNILSVLSLRKLSKKEQLNKCQELLEEFKVWQIRKSPATALSGGERRRVEIARALASDPSFILLDEPFAGVDPIAVNDIKSLVLQLKERGLGVLITDHNVRETLKLIDHAVIISSGVVLSAGTSEEVMANDDVRRVYLGEDFTI